VSLVKVAVSAGESRKIGLLSLTVAHASAFMH
jgi:hypothetical protein